MIFSSYTLLFCYSYSFAILLLCQRLTLHDHNGASSSKHQLLGVGKPGHDSGELSCTIINTVSVDGLMLMGQRFAGADAKLRRKGLQRSKHSKGSYMLS